MVKHAKIITDEDLLDLIRFDSVGAVLDEHVSGYYSSMARADFFMSTAWQGWYSLGITPLAVYLYHNINWYIYIALIHITE